MAFWWVAQNQSYKHERAGEYLWAPKIDKSNNTRFYWETMNSVSIGDSIFSYSNQKIPTISIAQTRAYDAPRPREFGDNSTWDMDGRKVDLQCQDLDSPISVPDIVGGLKPYLPETYSPINRNDHGNQGYLYELPDQAGRFLLSCAGKNESDIGELLIEKAISRSSFIDKTEREALVKSRRGQGKFRSDLLVLWHGKCAVTGSAIQQILRASHIKPWADSNNAERLDPNNGLLLVAHYDAAFDAGLITFENSGQIRLCPSVPVEAFISAGIKPSSSLARLQPEHKEYLSHHRRWVFQDQ
ncbi:HNH endonuclease [Nisaea sp.]|uniref:HNH endonuclease n=1 Tax=Nisaea sp. TaxID=2024842 RepID=UPI002B275D2C|nr:HNH endonuclease [Nisaea sp.]